MKKIYNKLFSTSERALISKDFSNLWTNRGMGLLLSLVPFILILVLPLVYLTLICLIPDTLNTPLDSIKNFIPDEYSYFSYKQGLYYIFVQMLSPMLFIVVPILISCLSTVFVFVGEKENGSMESLLYSSMPAKIIFKTKAICVFINSFVISFISFGVLEIIILIGNILLSVPTYVNLSFGFMAITGTPAIIFFCIYSIFWITRKSVKVIEAISACGYIMVPFIIAFLGEFAGIFDMSLLFVIVSVLVIVAADIWIYRILMKKIDNQTLMFIGKWGK